MFKKEFGRSMTTMLTTSQKNSLKYFENKIATIFVGPINRKFDEKTMIEYFVGLVTKIDDNGIWYEHLTTKCRNFIFYNQIVSISEELVKNKSDIP